MLLKYIEFLITRGLIGLFWLVPFRGLYILSDGVAYLLYKVIGYRRKVVQDNLLLCFPEKTEEEREHIARESYRNLADIILESLKGATVPISHLKQRYTYKNYDLINKVLQSGQSVVLAGGHYNNWEWGVLTIGGGIQGKSIGVYKPLSNKFTDRWFFKNRSRDGFMILKSMKDTFASVEEYRGTPTVFILVADQIPGNKKSVIPATFFGQHTACLPGTEAIAVKNGYPVMMYEIQRIKRGYYELTFSEVCMDTTHTAPGEVTQIFMSMVEQTIRKQPENWLWSHKRWKWRPE
ncbi:MAG: Lipid biosynthesis lauroyl acyltransferase [Bacteroidota bacterium]